MKNGLIIDVASGKKELEKLQVDSISQIVTKNPELKKPVPERKIKKVDYRIDPVNAFFDTYNSLLPQDLVLTANLKEVIRKLGNYFLGIDSQLNLNKGIYLEGPFGVGKTMLMASFQKWINQHFNSSGNGFSITSIEEIVDHYKMKGNLQRFIMNHEEYGFNRPRHLLINEFGKEVKDKIYGTEARQIINSLMMRRYELYQSFGKVTHVTSNYSPFSDDEALNDRYIEMFNFVKLEGKSLRK